MTSGSGFGFHSDEAVVIPSVDDGRSATMLERMARAICAVEGNNEADWPDFMNAARAALQAIREPDEAMQNVGVDAATGVFDGWVDEGQVNILFTAMIDAILNNPSRDTKG